MKSFQFQSLHNGERLVVTAGKHKGVVGEVINFVRSGSKVTIRPIDTLKTGTPDEITSNYVNFELADSQGNPRIAPILDMTGREIAVGTWAVYSFGEGSYNRHALEIGKVKEITKTGGLRVERLLKNGTKINGADQRWKERDERLVSDPDRALVLPCNEITMTEWVLKDFEDLKDQI
jgi:hypothetical protein